MSHLSIPIDISGDKSVSHEWGRANHMVLFNKSNFDKSKRNISKSSQIIELKWISNESFYKNRISRSLVSESSSIFKSIQRISERMDPLSRNELIKVSRKYRSVIHESFTNLKPDAAKNADSSALSNMFMEIEIVWNLCEILYMDIHPTGSLLNQLLTWIRWHFTDIVSKASDVIEAEMPHIHERYWDVIIEYLLRGEIDNARRLIELHPDADSKEEYILIREILHKMPLNSPHQLLHEFYLRWQSWHDDCQRLLYDGHFDLNSKLKMIVRIVSGDPLIYAEIINRFDSWYQLMVSFLFFTDPCIKENTLSSLSSECINIYFKNDKNEMTSFDKVLVAAFSYDLMQVIQQSCECFNDNWWFVTHFIDMLYNANQLKDHQIDSHDQFRESFIIDYSTSLMTHESLWQFGIDYLDFCPEYGLNHIEHNLQQIPIDNDLTVQKVLNIAHKRHLILVYKSVCKINARKWLNRNRLGSALYWAVRSEDSDIATHIADLFIDHYYKNGQFPDEDILSNLDPSMLISDRLTFLVKYYEFHQLMKDNKLKDAADLLVSLLSSGIAPEFFIVTLLMDSIPLLEAQSLVLNADQTHQINTFLEEMLNSNISQKEFQKEFIKDREDILRLCIARNMARARIFK